MVAGALLHRSVRRRQPRRALEMLAVAGNAGRIAQVDALRGIAALGVFVFHATNLLEFPKRVMPAFDLAGYHWHAVPSLFSLGATGVSLFFVVSGFCLALQPLRRAAPRIEGPRYFRDRLARIYPAYLLALLFSAGVATWFGIAWSGPELATFLLFLQGVVQRWVFSFNGALWSMATEVQFYLVFPLLYLMLVRHGRWQFLAGTAVLAMAWRVGVSVAPGADVVVGGITRSGLHMNLLPGRLVEFALGVAVAHAWLRDPASLRRLAWRALAPALVLGIGLRGFGPSVLADPATGLMYATILAVALTAPWRVRSDSMEARFGRASYSFFLLHFPVLAVVLHVLGGGEMLVAQGPYRALAILLAAGLLATLPMSTALYLGIELPAWRWLRGSRRADAEVPASDP